MKLHNYKAAVRFLSLSQLRGDIRNYLFYLSIALFGCWITACQENGGMSTTTYTVTFDTNGGSALSSQQVKSGEKATRPTPPTKTGFVFGGWFTDKDLTQSFDFDTPVKANITLYAKWSPEATTGNFVVTFDTNGGSLLDSQKVAANEKATRPTPPTKTGFVFGGWFTDEDLTQSFDFNTPVTADITLYAKWSPEATTGNFVVTLDTNGGSSVASQTVASDEKATRPPPPTKTGFVFDGWYSDSELSQAFDFNTPITANITLYAKWNPVEQLYTVTVTYNWNATDHGTLPGGAHFTTLFTVVHNDQFSLYKVGEKLTAGMERLAETGGTSGISSETADNSNVLSTAGKGTGGVTATFSFDVRMTAQYPYISAATMIAPSPDWIIGWSGILLYENNAFKEDVSGKMKAYDGGTEEGTGFSLSNAPTNPQESVTLLESMNGVALDNDAKPLGNYRIVKKN